MDIDEKINSRQRFVDTFFVGTLIYASALGFFNDYTTAITIVSYSTIFLVAVVMQLLTQLTFGLKGWVAHWFRQKEGQIYLLGMAVSVWLVMFLSKFVFLEVIDILFGPAVEVSGFIGLMLVILSTTAITAGYNLLYRKLS